MIDQGLDVWEYDVSRVRKKEEKKSFFLIFFLQGSAFGRVVDEDRGHTYLTTEKQREAAHLLLSQPDTPRDYLSWKGGFVVSEPLFTIKTPEVHFFLFFLVVLLLLLFFFFSPIFSLLFNFLFCFVLFCFCFCFFLLYLFFFFIQGTPIPHRSRRKSLQNQFLFQRKPFTRNISPHVT